MQPYAISLPKDFDAKASRRWPLYVVLHGRADTMDEAVFIRNHDGKPVPDDQTWIQLDVYGRGNNAYRWAGEADVFEAIQDVVKRYRIDERCACGAFPWGSRSVAPRPASPGPLGVGRRARGGVQPTSTATRRSKTPSSLHSTTCPGSTTPSATRRTSPTSRSITYGGEVDPQLLASQIMKGGSDQEQAR